MAVPEAMTVSVMVVVIMMVVVVTTILIVSVVCMPVCVVMVFTHGASSLRLRGYRPAG